MGFRTTQILYVTAKLGLADQLAPGPQTVADLAEVVGADASSLNRLLRALASLEIVAQTNEGTFALTARGELLRTDVPGSLHSLAILYGEPWLWQAYGQMLHSVRTGKPGFDQVHGQSLYEFLEHNPSAGEQFHAAMSGYSALETKAIVSAYDFTPYSTVIDVGGSQGALVAAVLQAHPHLKGIVFDLETIINQADQKFIRTDIAERIRFVAGDFFAGVPGKGDLYILKSVLHNWDDLAARRILQSCHGNMPGGARLLVIERVIPAVSEASESILFDMNMLVVTGGRERTEAEYRTLLEKSGFQLIRIMPTQAPVSLLEAVPIIR